MSSTTQILQQVKLYYSDESKWTKHSWFRDTQGKALTLGDYDKAECACLAGSIVLSSSEGISIISPVQRIIAQAIDALYPNSYSCLAKIASFNDDTNTTFADLHKVIDKAIELSEVESAV